MSTLKSTVRASGLPATSVLVLALGGCFGSTSYFSSTIEGRNVSLAAFDADRSSQDSRTLTHSIAETAPGPIRVLNLAGPVELIASDGDGVEVEARVHADAGSAVETDTLLESIAWTTIVDHNGRTWHCLNLHDRDHAMHYPGLRSGIVTVDDEQMQARIVARRSITAPTLFSELTVACPAETPVIVRTVVGDVRGDALEARLTADTCWGNVVISSHVGELAVDTGSGDIEIGSVEGRLEADTGSGDIAIGSVEGQLEADTGSGHIIVDRLAGQAVLDTGSGDIRLASVEAAHVMADTGSGSVEVRNGSVDSADLDTGSGNISVVDVDFATCVADTGSGNITIDTPMARADRIDADTGSGNVTIYAGPDASFRLDTSMGSGRLRVGFDDAELIWRGRELVGAMRGDRRTWIRVDTGSGSCRVSPRRSTPPGGAP
jgi:DUF4097 and DUF4098 domain-containing protein YvlB